MLRPGNDATPAVAATALVPASVPPPGFVPIATVMVPVKPVAVLPWLSRAVTWTAGAIATPAVALGGCWVNTSTYAVPGAMVNAALVAPVGPVALAVSVYPVPAALMLRLLKDATPAVAATAAVP